MNDKLSLERHNALGNELQSTIEFLGSIAIELRAAYGARSREFK